MRKAKVRQILYRGADMDDDADDDEYNDGDGDVGWPGL